MVARALLFLFALCTCNIFGANQHRILLVHLAPWHGGDGVHTLNFYLALKKQGYHVSILVLEKSAIIKQLLDQKLPFHATKISPLSKNKTDITQVAKTISNICIKEHISVVNCNHLTEVPALIEASKLTPIATVFTYHLPYMFDTNKLKGLNTIICVDERFNEFLNKENKERNLGISPINYIPPLYDDNKFTSYIPTQSKEEFFQKTYGIKIKPWPIICMIGNMYTDIKHKNYPLLLEAISQLVYKYNKKIQVIIAGGGVTRSRIEKLARHLKLNHHVHFLGFTNNVPDLLYHADMFVLTSQREAFGIAFLEAGLMSKVAIGARNTGAQSIILHEKTGLLFKNDDLQDLVTCIQKILDNPVHAKTLGLHAFEHVTKNFAPSFIFNQIEACYRAIELPKIC